MTKENRKSEREITTLAELLCLSSDAVERKNSAFRERKKEKKKGQKTRCVWMIHLKHFELLFFFFFLSSLGTITSITKQRGNGLRKGAQKETVPRKKKKKN